jgi:pilus assembly protein Flp/PilA
MLTYLNHFKMRYLNEKGQGMVEYAVIVAVVVGVGIALLGTGEGTIYDQVKTLYTSVFTKAAKIAE